MVLISLPSMDVVLVQPLSAWKSINKYSKIINPVLIMFLNLIFNHCFLLKQRIQGRIMITHNTKQNIYTVHFNWVSNNPEYFP